MCNYDCRTCSWYSFNEQLKALCIGSYICIHVLYSVLEQLRWILCWHNVWPLFCFSESKSKNSCGAFVFYFLIFFWKPSSYSFIWMFQSKIPLYSCLFIYISYSYMFIFLAVNSYNKCLVPVCQNITGCFLCVIDQQLFSDYGIIYCKVIFCSICRKEICQRVEHFSKVANSQRWLDF